MVSVEKAAEIIRGGGVVAFPTETVYGLGANALDPVAVARIFALKARPAFDPLIVHVSSLSGMLPLIKGPVPALAIALAERFWPGPLTMVLDKSDATPDIVTAGLKRVGIRAPRHPLALALLEAAGCPIAAPSANKFGRVSPTTAQHVRRQLPELECVLDGGPCQVGIESTVVALHDDGFELLRPGFVTPEQLLEVAPQSGRNTAADLVSPGLLLSHYSPEKPVYIEGEAQLRADTDRGVYLSFSGKAPEGYARVEYLSRDSDLTEAAANLFGALHRLEESAEAFMVVEALPERGLGVAIMDRLRKAAYRYQQNDPQTH
ncbi:MAG: L-threonylcarbamoyladenylate synthase [Saprospiraceae bacterium]